MKVLTFKKVDSLKIDNEPVDKYIQRVFGVGCKQVDRMDTCVCFTCKPYDLLRIKKFILNSDVEFCQIMIFGDRWLFKM